jgi:hypothetical protein
LVLTETFAEVAPVFTVLPELQPASASAPAAATEMRVATERRDDKVTPL